MDRGAEIYRLHRKSIDEMVAEAQGRLTVVDALDDLHTHFARAISDEIAANNRSGRATTLILPVGPTGQYPMFADIVNDEGISLASCTFFFMDENADLDGVEVSEDHPESFRGAMRPTWDAIRTELRPDPPEQLTDSLDQGWGQGLDLSTTSRLGAGPGSTRWTLWRSSRRTCQHCASCLVVRRAR